MSRYLLAPLRCIALVVLAAAGVVLAVLAVIGATIVVGFPLSAYAVRGYGQLARVLSRRWGGVRIAAPDLPAVPEPARRDDGWYVYDRQLFRRRWFPAMMLRLEALSADSRFSREFLWLVLTPLTGALAAAVPVLLLATGAVAAVRPDLAAGFAGTAAGLPVEFGWRAAGVVLIAAGLGGGPIALRMWARWNQILLRAPQQSWWHRSGVGPWIMRRVRAAWAAAGLAGLSLAGFVLGLVGLAGIVMTWMAPYVFGALRPYLGFYRRRVATWAGVDLPEPYRPFPRPPGPGPDGLYREGRVLYRTQQAAIKGQRYGWMLKDPASWRDLLWLLTAPLTAPLSLVPAVLIAVGFFGLTWQPAWWAPWAVPLGLATGVWVTPWYSWYAVALLWQPLQSVPAWSSIVIGLLLSLLGVALAGPVLRLKVRADRLLLAPTRASVLAQRVDQLTETRSEALDAQAAELRRIERDLHDGAQARLVAVGLSLATVEQLMQTDPMAARALLAQARESSATALVELRALVRGIHPPVLAERGLADAVRAVALDTPLAVRVRADLPGQAPAPVESAAYFAVCEALANAARHAHASHVDIDLQHRDGILRVRVADDGSGGADPARGSGLRGIQRRLASFDGTLHLSSPPGGPTVLTMEIACALSSPKTSTSSATA